MSQQQTIKRGLGNAPQVQSMPIIGEAVPSVSLPLSNQTVRVADPYQVIETLKKELAESNQENETLRSRILLLESQSSSQSFSDSIGLDFSKYQEIMEYITTSEEIIKEMLVELRLIG